MMKLASFWASETVYFCFTAFHHWIVIQGLMG